MNGFDSLLMLDLAQAAICSVAAYLFFFYLPARENANSELVHTVWEPYFLVYGLVVAAFPDRGKVLVQGVNVVTKNKKVTYQGQRGAKEGGITHEEAPIDVSNVQLVDPDSKKAARVGYRFDEDGNKIRVARPSGKDI